MNQVNNQCLKQPFFAFIYFLVPCGGNLRFLSHFFLSNRFSKDISCCNDWTISTPSCRDHQHDNVWAEGELYINISLSWLFGQCYK